MLQTSRYYSSVGRFDNAVALPHHKLDYSLSVASFKIVTMGPVVAPVRNEENDEFKSRPNAPE
jgi:hypothetical protein